MAFMIPQEDPLTMNDMCIEYDQKLDALKIRKNILQCLISNTEHQLSREFWIRTLHHTCELETKTKQSYHKTMSRLGL